MSAERAKGQCLCGAVQYEIELPAKWCANCHCSLCRRSHGAAYVTWVGVDAAGFRITTGEDDLVRHPSSDRARRSFCGICGSRLLFEGQRWKDEVHVARASITTDLDLTPQAHAYFDDRAHWAPLGDDGLLRLGGESGTEPIA